VITILQNALKDERGMAHILVEISDAVIQSIADVADGDARIGLNLLEMTVKLSPMEKETIKVSKDELKKVLQSKTIMFENYGEEFYNLISALHKSMRGSDPDASLYYLGRMLEGGADPLYIARRCIRFASEDVGMKDPNALVQAVASFQACQMLGLPECEMNLAQIVVYLAMAPKSNSLYSGYASVKEALKSEPYAPVPLHLRNAPTKLMKELHYSEGYKYNPDFDEPVDQQYLPDSLKDRKFFQLK